MNLNGEWENITSINNTAQPWNAVTMGRGGKCCIGALRREAHHGAWSQMAQPYTILAATLSLESLHRVTPFGNKLHSTGPVLLMIQLPTNKSIVMYTIVYDQLLHYSFPLAQP